MGGTILPSEMLTCVSLLQRPRSARQYISQEEFEAQEEDFILGRKYNVLEKLHNLEYQSDHGYVREMDGKGKQKRMCRVSLFIHQPQSHH